MAIVALPDDIRMNEIATCAICGEEKPLETMTAGMLRADGTQAFGCESHRQERTIWTLGWLRMQHQLTFSVPGQAPARILHA